MASMIFSAILYRNGKKFNGQVIIMKGLFEDPEKKYAIFKTDNDESYVVRPEPGKPYRGNIWLYKENDEFADKILKGDLKMAECCGRYIIKKSEINTSKWFNIKEKEPSIKGGTYLVGVIDNYGDTVVFIELIATYIARNVFNVEGKGEVYADYWMPLPEPPEELKS